MPKPIKHSCIWQFKNKRWQCRLCDKIIKGRLRKEEGGSIDLTHPETLELINEICRKHEANNNLPNKPSL